MFDLGSSLGPCSLFYFHLLCVQSHFCPGAGHPLLGSVGVAAAEKGNLVGLQLKPQMVGAEIKSLELAAPVPPEALNTLPYQVLPAPATSIRTGQGLCPEDGWEQPTVPAGWGRARVCPWKGEASQAGASEGEQGEGRTGRAAEEEHLGAASKFIFPVSPASCPGS